MSDSSVSPDHKPEKNVQIKTTGNTIYNIKYAESVHTGVGDNNSAKGITMSLLWLMIYNLEFKCSFCYTGCSKSLRHILTLNISKTIKDIKTHLVNSESL